MKLRARGVETGGDGRAPPSLRRDTRGVSNIEYIILVGVIGLVAVVAWRRFSGSVLGALNREAVQVRTLEATQGRDVSGGQPVDPRAGAQAPPDDPGATSGGSIALNWPSRAAAQPSAGGADDTERSGAPKSRTAAAREALLVASVLKVMCPQDKAILQDLKARGVTVTAYDQIFFDDPYYDGKRWTTRPFPAGGTTNGLDISIAVTTSKVGNAMTLRHEAVHTTQPESMAWREKEYDAYYKTEEWAIQHGLPPHDPSFRKTDAAGNPVIDTAAIHAMVDGDYPGVTSKAAPSAPPEQVIDRTPDGNTIVARADGTTYERPPKAGDSFSGDQQTKPTKGTPIDIKALQCP